MLVMSVQAISTLLPLTPGGAGAQQALLVATLTGPGPIAVLTYSVGQQIAIAVWTALLGFLALAFVFRTTDWRSLIRRAQAEADKQEAAEGLTPAQPAVAGREGISQRQGGSSARGEAEVVSARQGLQWHQGRIVLEAEPDARPRPRSRPTRRSARSAPSRGSGR